MSSGVGDGVDSDVPFCAVIIVNWKAHPSGVERTHGCARLMNKTVVTLS